MTTFHYVKMFMMMHLEYEYTLYNKISTVCLFEGWNYRSLLFACIFSAYLYFCM